MIRKFVLLAIVAAGSAWNLSQSTMLSVEKSADGDAGAQLPRAFVDGRGAGWVVLTLDDFTNINCQPETWTSKDGLIHCTGTPVGVTRSRKQYTNFELVAEWQHLKSAGNSGIFLWAPEQVFDSLQPNSLPPGGIEVQVLDLGYETEFEKKNGSKADWFTSHGDVFPVGSSDMTPFPPAAPDGKRSFPRKRLSRGINEWNHYYVRAINGEVRLWVNGEEVSGGHHCTPCTGYLCLESEGSPVQFRNIRIRELP